MTHTPITYILFNGPPGCGKSTVARAVAGQLFNYTRVVSESFAAPMKHFISVALGHKYMEMPKDIPLAILRGKSVREFLITLSEDHIKPLYGDDIFGRWLEHRVLRIIPRPTFVIIDDAGFEDEVAALPNKFVVHIERDGCTFEHDSRNYLKHYDHLFSNNSHIDELWINVGQLVQTIRDRYLGETV